MIKLPSFWINSFDGEYYIYYVNKGDVTIYIGLGKGDRMLHPTSGKSHSPLLNEEYFRHVLLGEEELIVEKLVENLSRDSAFDLERYLIAKYKPSCNVRGKTEPVVSRVKIKTEVEKPLKDKKDKPITLQQYLQDLCTSADDETLLDYMYESAKDWKSVYKGNVINTFLYVYIATTEGDTLARLESIRERLLSGELVHHGYRIKDFREDNQGRPMGFVVMLGMKGKEKAAYYRWINSKGIKPSVDEEEDIRMVKEWLVKRRARVG